MKKKKLLMLLCALVLGAWIGPLRADPGGAIDLRVMSFNIRCLNTSDAAENQWTNRIDRVCALVREVQPDLLGVQEAVPQQYEDVKAGLDGYSSIFAGRDDGPRARARLCSTVPTSSALSTAGTSGCRLRPTSRL